MKEKKTKKRKRRANTKHNQQNELRSRYIQEISSKYLVRNNYDIAQIRLLTYNTQQIKYDIAVELLLNVSNVM